MRRTVRSLELAVLLALTFSTASVYAQTQTTGEITGVVTDPAGAAVAKAQVVLKDLAKGSTTTTETNRDGVYHFQLLPPSNYTVSITSTGFEGVTRTLTVALGQVTTGNVQLPIGSSSTTVTLRGGTGTPGATR